jgi:hypothetical protein
VIQNILVGVTRVFFVFDGLDAGVAFPDGTSLRGCFVDDGREAEGDMLLGLAEDWFGAMVVALDQRVEILFADGEGEDGDFLQCEAVEEEFADGAAILLFNEVGIEAEKFFGVVVHALCEF